MSAAPPTPDLSVREAGFPHESDIGDLGASAMEFAQSLSALFESEIALARYSLRALLMGMIAAPVIVVGLWLGLMSLLVLEAHAAGCSWPAAVGLGIGAQLLALLFLVRALRRWTRDLTLYRSRELISQFIGVSK